MPANIASPLTVAHQGVLSANCGRSANGSICRKAAVEVSDLGGLSFIWCCHQYVSVLNEMLQISSEYGK
jgi:hypothetical protein